MRDVHRPWIRQASSWGGGGGFSRARMLRIIAGPRPEYSFSTHLVSRLACTHAGEPGSHPSSCLSWCPGIGSSQQRASDARRETQYRGHVAAELASSRAGLPQCLSNRQRRSERARPGGSPCCVDALLWVSKRRWDYVVSNCAPQSEVFTNYVLG
jgi:hypothetical protein